MNIRLTGLFTLLSPLSHIGEAISTTSYLAQEPVLQPDGRLEEVFVYSGNAWRGHLRDLAAAYMLDALGVTGGLSLDTFHLLFSGGRIGGEQSINLDQARRFRRAIPLVALLGGGIGNQVLAGKVRVSNAYPLCEEAMPALPLRYRAAATSISYRGLTFEKSFSRKDDGKDDRLNGYADTVPQPGQMALPGGEDEANGKRARKKDDGPADQMRMTVELLAAGARLATEIDALDVSEIELGCLVSAVHRFSRSPHIGGQANRGHGRVALTYHLRDFDTGDEYPFLSVEDRCLLTPPAQAAKDAYDQHLRSLYDAMLAGQGGEMRALLGVGS